jgi:hypothetical protein
MYVSSKLNIMVDGLFERMMKKLFPGHYPLQPILVERAIEKAIVENTKVFQSGLFPPNRLEIVMNEEDYADYKKIEGLYKKQLEETAQNFIENEFQEHSLGKAKPAISVKADSKISKGTITVRADHFEETFEGLK